MFLIHISASHRHSSLPRPSVFLPFLSLLSSPTSQTLSTSRVWSCHTTNFHASRKTRGRFFLGSSLFFFFFLILFIYLFILFMAVLGLCFCVRAFSSCGKWGPLLIAVRLDPVLIHRFRGAQRDSTMQIAQSASSHISPGCSLGENHQQRVLLSWAPLLTSSFPWLTNSCHALLPPRLAGICSLLPAEPAPRPCAAARIS